MCAQQLEHVLAQLLDRGGLLLQSGFNVQRFRHGGFFLAHTG